MCINSGVKKYAHPSELFLAVCFSVMFSESITGPEVDALMHHNLIVVANSDNKDSS